MSYTPPPGSGGGGAPTDATYVTTTAHGSLSAEALLSAVIGRGTVASRPAFGVAGRLYYGTDTSILYRDSGTAWDNVEGAGSAGAPTDATYVTTTAHASLSAEALLSDIIGRGLLSARPAFGTSGRLYYATDTSIMYRDSGSAWENVEGAGGGGGSTSAMGAHVGRVANQAITTAVDTALSFDTEYRDDGGFWVSGSPTRLTIPTTGWHNVAGWIQWESNATGLRYINIKINNTTWNGTSSNGPNSATVDARLAVSMNLYLVAGDYVELFVFHTRGSNLNVIGAVSISRTRAGDETLTAVHASRPTAGNDGTVFLPTDAYTLERDNGTTWVPWGPIYPLTPPIDSDFSWVTTQGTATVTAAKSGIFLLAPTIGTATDTMRVRGKTAPATPYVITAAFIPSIVQSFGQCGVCFRQSSDGKLVVYGIQARTTNATDMESGWALNLYKYTNPTTFASSYFSINKPWFGSVVFLRIADNGTNRICSVSADGQNFTLLHTIGRTDYLTADQVGFFSNSCNATFGAGMTLLSWVQT